MFKNLDYKKLLEISKWNGTTTYNYIIEREFGTDYGTCCWYTPQLNLTEVVKHQKHNNMEEPDWGYWFSNIKKVSKAFFFQIF